MIFDVATFTEITMIACREAHRQDPTVPPGDLLNDDKIIEKALVEYFNTAGGMEPALVPIAIESYRATERMMEFSGAVATAAVARMLRTA